MRFWGRFPFTKQFQKYRWGCKWNTRLFGSLHWKYSRINGISEKVVPFSWWKLPNGKFVFHLQTSRLYCSLLFLVPYLSRSFNRPCVPWLPRMELVANGTCSSQTEIPNRNFLNVFVNRKRPEWHTQSWLFSSSCSVESLLKIWYNKGNKLKKISFSYPFTSCRLVTKQTSPRKLNKQLIWLLRSRSHPFCRYVTIPRFHVTRVTLYWTSRHIF